jgi:hypothetical protein
MAKCYFELRKQSARGTDSIAADIMRHLHTRQHLGKAVILCDQPLPLLAASRKQWLKLARTIQKQRASTLNADKILKYTHTIAHMQHMRFTAKTPLEDPDADVYFLTEQSAGVMPIHCFSIYVIRPASSEASVLMIQQLPSDALIVDYAHSTSWAKLGLQSKVFLEAQVRHEWDKMQQFMSSHQIHVSSLAKGSLPDIEAMDNALDTLLGVSRQFLRIATEFQHTLELARPLRISRDDRLEYDSVIILAYRVQALSPGAFTQHFLETYNEDDTFFLYDATKRRLVLGGESLAEAFNRHTAAGRKHLATALQRLYTYA